MRQESDGWVDPMNLDMVIANAAGDGIAVAPGADDDNNDDGGDE